MSSISFRGIHWIAFVIFLAWESSRGVKANSGGFPELDMYQIDSGSRSIGSNVTVVSEFRIPTREESVIIHLDMKHSANESLTTYIGECFYANYNETIFILPIHDHVPHLNLSQGFISYPENFYIAWLFVDLPENYDGLELRTTMGLNNDVSYFRNHTLVVEPCESSITVSTFEQRSMYNITSSQLGHFGDTAECQCLREDEILFRVNGTRAGTTAECAYNAVWSGCEELQCWSEPQNVTIAQLNESISASAPFNCSFYEGFPLVDTVLFKIGDVYVSELYELKSSDHGKNLSCEVTSGYTSATGKKAESSTRAITVYYPPENSVLSEDFVSIEIDSFKILNFTFFANPEAGKISLTLDGDTCSSAGLFVWKGNYSARRRYIYELAILVSTTGDYGSYNVCASTSRPLGQACSLLIISNPIPDYSTTAVNRTDSQFTLEVTYSDEIRPLAVLVGASVAGVIILFVISVGVFKIVQRKRKENADVHIGNMREPEMTASDGDTDYEIYDGDPEYDGIGPAPPISEIPRANAAYAEVI